MYAIHAEKHMESARTVIALMNVTIAFGNTLRKYVRIQEINKYMKAEKRGIKNECSK